MLEGRGIRGESRIDVPVTSTNAQFIWQLCRRQGKWILFAMGTALVNMGITLLTAQALRDIVDLGVVEQSEPIAPLAIRLIVLGFFSGLSSFVLLQTMDRIVYHLEWELRMWLHQGIHARDPRHLDTMATGQMVTRSMTDLEHMQLFVLLIPFLVGTGLTLIALGAWLFVQNPLLMLVVLAAFPFNLYLLKRMGRRLWGMSWLSLNRRAQVTTTIDEAVRGVRVAKAFAREDEENSRLKDAAVKAYSVMLSRTRLLAKFDFLLKMIPTILNGFLLLLGGLLITRGAITTGVLVVFLRFSTGFLVFARALDEVANVWQFARAASGRIFEVVTKLAVETNGENKDKTDLTGTQDLEVPHIRDGDGGRLEAHAAAVRLRDISMAFDGRQAFTGLDLSVDAGQTLVVLGGPRSGKTTVAGLIAGAFAPTSGDVLVGGRNPNVAAREEQRRAVQIVTEEPFLFGRTLRENLEMGAPPDERDRLDDTRLRAVLWAAGADKVLDELPQGLDAPLGDRGLTLSGGQRQRIALARALVSAPRVLVLDDALMAVNPALELEILRRIRSHAPDMTIVYLTRRKGPEIVADVVASLPVPNGEVVSTTAQPPPDSRDDLPASTDLEKVLSELPPERDLPLITDEHATQSDEPPRVVSMLRPLAGPVARASLVLLALGIVTLIPTALSQVVIDAAREGDISLIWIAAAAIIVAGLGLGALHYVIRIMRKKVEEGVVYLLRRQLFHRLTRLGIDFYDRELPGHVAARAVYDLDRIADFVEDGPFEIARSVTMLVLTFAVIMWWSPPVAVVAAVFIPLLMLISAAYVPVADRAWRRVRERLGETIGRFQEDFAGRYVIDSLGAEPVAHSEFARITWRLRAARRWAAIVTNVFRGLVLFLLEVASAVVLWRAGNLAIAGALTVGAMIALRTWLDDALVPLPRLAGVLRQYMVAKASIRTLRQPFESPIRPAERPVGPCPELSGAVRFDDVGFVYPETEREVLHEVNLEIPAGETCAVVGPTGAGKTSLVKLLMAVYDPDHGRVLVDDIDLRQMSLREYRRRLGVVPQDAFCFRGTVASNIAYGRPSASREEVEEAARAVGAYEALASIPGGFDAVVEEEGRNLTGGQRQLVALARAWLVRPSIVILDEATSSLDAELEERVLEAVRTLGCTTVVVTHRLHVAQQADRIVVVDGGRVVEQGTHEDLTAGGGVYSSLWARGDDLDEMETLPT